MPLQYQLKITLIGTKPPIWRRIEVPSTILLCCLHDIFQVLMGWSDSHMHQFAKDGKRWGMASFDEFNELGLLDEQNANLAQVLKSKGDSLFYDYDFGDDWRHKVVLEQILPGDDARNVAVCRGGARNCPPESVGGVAGYAMFLKKIAEPGNNDFDHILEWMEDAFDPEKFDVEDVNGVLSEMHLPLEHER